jgi:hypothetical protein
VPVAAPGCTKRPLHKTVAVAAESAYFDDRT